ncbi:MAG: hypothetical protein QG620_817 [Patescibacteria group bacterium]|nr:hypothetical protein [Patescibacteria group bacterium]
MELDNDKRDFFTTLGLFWLGFLFLGIILALTGFFYKNLFVLYFILGGGYLLYVAPVSKIFSGFKKDSQILFILAVSLFAIILLSLNASPTVFSGRDQGSFSEAAIRLSQNRQLEFSTPASSEFFNIYGPGKALNFPGFSYTANGNLTTQFPVGYTSWLAAWFSFFGLAGFAIANGITFFIFLVSSYLLTENYLGKSAALAAYFLIATSFVFSWFLKFTLSENLALALVWFGIFQFYLFLKNKRLLHLGASLGAFGILLFIRIEAWFFLLMIFSYLVFNAKKQKESLRSYFKPQIILPLAIIGIFYLLTLKVNSPYYIALAKGFVKSFSGDNASLSEAVRDPLYALKIFSLYGIAGYLLLSFLAIARLIKQKKHLLLLPFLIVLPSFFYLLHPGISSDHPWFLRRFIFSIIPAIIFYAVYFLYERIRTPLLRWTLLLVLLFGNLFVLLPLGTFYPQKNLLNGVKVLSSEFKDTDLVLVDREATGDGWAMMAGPMNTLYGKQAVYFFNPENLQRIDLEKFTGVYFIIPDKNLEFYEKSGLPGQLIPVKDYSMESSDLNSTSFELPAPQNIQTRGKIYLYQP